MKESFKKEFGENLRKLREAQKITKAELAADLDIEISQISRIERGIITTSAENAYKIAVVFCFIGAPSLLFV